MKNIFKVLWIGGAVLVAIGEAVTAFNGTRGDTISEGFERLPSPAKYFVVFGAGCVFGHWCWPMPARDDVTVNVKNVESMTVEEHA